MAVIANARKILMPNGVERLEKLRIGGIDQWVSIRGTDRRNPVLLYVHGGPGYVSIPMSWWFSRGWEEYFTVRPARPARNRQDLSPHRSRQGHLDAQNGKDDRRRRRNGRMGTPRVWQGQDFHPRP